MPRHKAAENVEIRNRRPNHRLQTGQLTQPQFSGAYSGADSALLVTPRPVTGRCPFQIDLRPMENTLEPGQGRRSRTKQQSVRCGCDL